jgi:hypothetical protein
MGKVRTVIPYASRTGTRRNLAALRKYGWNLLVSARGPHRNEGFSYGIDNGAWTSFQKNEPFNDRAFFLVLERLGAEAEWIVVPDVVSNRRASLSMTERWLPRLEGYPRLLVSLQDGMDLFDVLPWLGPKVGIFLGGSTEWKLENMPRWGAVSRALRCYYHVARVNTVRRILAARRAGAHSIDGTSASRFSVNVPHLSDAVFGTFAGCEPRTDGWFRGGEST